MQKTLLSSLSRIVTTITLVAWPALLPNRVLADSCLTPPAGLVAWWPGEGDCLDWAGTNNGTAVGGVTFVPGEVEDALSFDGATGFVQLPTNLFAFPFSGTGSRPFSFELWFRTTAGGVILGQEQDTSVPFQTPLNYVPAIYIGTDGKLRTAMFWDGGTNGGALGDPIVATNAVCDGNFHHLAVVYDGTNQALYVDNELAGSRGWAQLGYATGYNYQFGTGYTGSGWPGGNGGWYSFNGLVDEAHLYNRALSSNEVASIYAAGSAGLCKTPTILSQPLSRTMAAGKAAAFSVSASGAPSLSFQWLCNGTNLTNNAGMSGCESRNLTLGAAQIADTGTYQVVVTNALGSATSAPAILTVLAPTAYCDAVADFSTNGNPNGVWSYGWCTNVGGTFQLLTNLNSYASGIGGYWNGLAVPNSCVVWGNATANPVLTYSTVWVDPDTLMMDPESYAVLVRFTAPSNGAYEVQGLFRLQCTITHAHDLTIQVNTNIIAYYLYTQGGQLDTEYPFDFPCNLRQGDTLDFIVSCHGGDYVALATGLKATLVLSSLPPIATQILSPQLAGGNFTFSFQTVSNQSYTVEQNADLTTTNWIPCANHFGDGSLFHFTVPATNHGTLFFRLREP
jgi:hypothetical protein